MSCDFQTLSSRDDSPGLASNGGPSSLGSGRVRDVHDHHAAVGHALVASIGPAPDVGVVPVDRDGGVHAAVHQRVVPDLPLLLVVSATRNRPGRPGLTALLHANVRGLEVHQGRGDGKHDGDQQDLEA